MGPSSHTPLRSDVRGLPWSLTGHKIIDFISVWVYLFLFIPDKQFSPKYQITQRWADNFGPVRIFMSDFTSRC